MRFVSNTRLDHVARPFLAGDIEGYARDHPFQYKPEELSNLQQFIFPVPLDRELRLWGDQFFRDDGTADTFDLLSGMTQTIFRSFRHVNRHEEGIQEPVESVVLRSGSCRDLAVLMMAALRSRGLAARFVSGYRRLSEDEQEDQVLNGGNTHAWLQAYIPGPGWVDFDPSAGTMGNENLVRVAAVAHPHEAIPTRHLVRPRFGSPGYDGRREGELGRLAGTFPGPLFCPSGTREDSADPQCKFVPVMRFPMRVGSQRP